jgi:hypothetical protein
MSAVNTACSSAPLVSCCCVQLLLLLPNNVAVGAAGKDPLLQLPANAEALMQLTQSANTSELAYAGCNSAACAAACSAAPVFASGQSEPNSAAALQVACSEMTYQHRGVQQQGLNPKGAQTAPAAAQFWGTAAPVEAAAAAVAAVKLGLQLQSSIYTASQLPGNAKA